MSSQKTPEIQYIESQSPEGQLLQSWNTNTQILFLHKYLLGKQTRDNEIFNELQQQLKESNYIIRNEEELHEIVEVIEKFRAKKIQINIASRDSIQEIQSEMNEFRNEALSNIEQMTPQEFQNNFQKVLAVIAPLSTFDVHHDGLNEQPAADGIAGSVLIEVMIHRGYSLKILPNNTVIVISDNPKTHPTENIQKILSDSIQKDPSIFSIIQSGILYASPTFLSYTKSKGYENTSIEEYKQYLSQQENTNEDTIFLGSFDAYSDFNFSESARGTEYLEQVLRETTNISKDTLYINLDHIDREGIAQETLKPIHDAIRKIQNTTSDTSTISSRGIESLSDNSGLWGIGGLALLGVVLWSMFSKKGLGPWKTLGGIAGIGALATIYNKWDDFFPDPTPEPEKAEESDKSLETPKNQPSETKESNESPETPENQPEKPEESAWRESVIFKDGAINIIGEDGNPIPIDGKTMPPEVREHFEKMKISYKQFENYLLILQVLQSKKAEAYIKDLQDGSINPHEFFQNINEEIISKHPKTKDDSEKIIGWLKDPNEENTLELYRYIQANFDDVGGYAMVAQTLAEQIVSKKDVNSNFEKLKDGGFTIKSVNQLDLSDKRIKSLKEKLKESRTVFEERRDELSETVGNDTEKLHHLEDEFLSQTMYLALQMEMAHEAVYSSKKLTKEMEMFADIEGVFWYNIKDSRVNLYSFILETLLIELVALGAGALTFGGGTAAISTIQGARVAKFLSNTGMVRTLSHVASKSGKAGKFLANTVWEGSTFYVGYAAAKSVFEHGNMTGSLNKQGWLDSMLFMGAMKGLEKLHKMKGVGTGITSVAKKTKIPESGVKFVLDGTLLGAFMGGTNVLIEGGDWSHEALIQGFMMVLAHRGMMRLQTKYRLKTRKDGTPVVETYTRNINKNSTIKTIEALKNNESITINNITIKRTGKYEYEYTNGTETRYAKTPNEKSMIEAIQHEGKLQAIIHQNITNQIQALKNNESITINNITIKRTGKYEYEYTNGTETRYAKNKTDIKTMTETIRKFQQLGNLNIKSVMPAKSLGTNQIIKNHTVEIRSDGTINVTKNNNPLRETELEEFIKNNFLEIIKKFGGVVPNINQTWKYNIRKFTEWVNKSDMPAEEKGNIRLLISEITRPGRSITQTLDILVNGGSKKGKMAEILQLILLGNRSPAFNTFDPYIRLVSTGSLALVTSGFNPLSFESASDLLLYQYIGIIWGLGGKTVNIANNIFN